MTDISSDMDRYLRRKRASKSFPPRIERSRMADGPSWWDSLFSAKPRKRPEEELSPMEKEQLETMESDLKHGEARIEAIKETEHELEEQQERKVGMYHNFMKMFSRKREDVQEFEHMPEAAPTSSEDVSKDFKTISAIYLKWMGRLPTRIRDEFRDSEDYAVVTEILQRRGVAKKK